jgi:D-alanyl-D-alanine carboxypeptidase-like protein
MPRAFRHLLPCSFAALVAITVPGVVAGCAPGEPDSVPDEVAGDGPEPTGNRGDAVGSGSVNDAVAASCATSSVKGLSDQIIAEGQCLEPSAYAKLPELGNLELGPNVFPFLEEPARDQLVAALKAAPKTTMTVNSMLRTVAQQYLLYRWYQAGSCGIGLAAKPGNSNHETGLAFDTSEASAWKSTLSSHGFKWFGSADPVHFDYVGSGAKSYKGTDVKAFQRLWNRNNPKDIIAEDGAYGPNTEARLKKAPAQGFKLGADCGPEDEGSGGASNSSASSSTSGGGAEACAHAICATGGVLASACDPCAKTVCDSDSYCCATAWDATCVQEVGTLCGAACGGA